MCRLVCDFVVRKPVWTIKVLLYSHFQEQRGSDAAVMLYGFLLIVILLNKKRRDAGEPVDDSFLFKSPEEFIHSIVSSH